MYLPLILNRSTMRKGVDSFLILLGIAAIVIVALLAFSQFYAIAPSGGGFTAFEEFDPGIVGFSSESVSKTVQVGEVRVGETQEEPLKGFAQAEISQGLFGGSQEELALTVSPAFLELKRGVKVSFSVLEANPLGNMKVLWNGKEVYNARPSGLTTFEIESQYITRENTLIVLADGPGFQFWASTSYTVTNFKASLLYGPQKVVPFELLPSEIQQFERGEVSFFSSGGGRLDIKVNGLAVYSKIPSGAGRVEFNLSSAPLNAGGNVLAFVSTGSNVLSGVNLHIFTLGNELVKFRTFSLTGEQLKNFRGSGRIEFTIDRTIRAGVLTLSLNGKALNLQALQDGLNLVSYRKEDLKEGENTIELSGTGAWEISGVRIGFSP